MSTGGSNNFTLSIVGYGGALGERNGLKCLRDCLDLV